jgi:hypothetical protein
MLTDNSELSKHFIKSSAENPKVKFNQLSICVPIQNDCGGYFPKDGRWRFFADIDVMNDGLTDISTKVQIKFTNTNKHMSIISSEEF